jgi:hypothetical protein
MRQQEYEQALQRILTASHAAMARVVVEAEMPTKEAAERAFADMSLTLADIAQIARAAFAAPTTEEKTDEVQ